MPNSDPSSSTLSDPPTRQTAKRRSTSSESPSATTRPRSPPSLDAPSTADGVRASTKRARKAINCGPCRLSKLKCDRERPCSSCKLRGTTASCYQGLDGGSPTVFRTDDPSDPRGVNTAVEFSKIRQALAVIEAHVHYIQRSPALSGSTSSHFDASITSGPINHPPTSQIKQDLPMSDLSEQEAAPGAQGQSNRCGLYTGPTSAVSHLSSSDADWITSASQKPSPNEQGIRDGGGGVPEAAPILPEHTRDAAPTTHGSDRDLCEELPHVSVIDGLIDFYFEYCNWVFRFVNHRAFTAAWARYKSGAGADRIGLATVCMIMAVTLHYLPSGHELLPESRAYTMDLIELLLIRTHYLALSTVDSEEAWRVKGELVNMATAMGLHRDPGKDMPLEAAERRRWAWWHILLIERWQAFLFGRPIAIASHHFDTRLPSYCDPEVDPSGRLYDANIHLFRIAFILGDIMDDAVSLRPVPYESVLAKDRVLQEWWDTLPVELDMDDYSLVSFLASSTTSKRRVGVQSVVVRTVFLLIRCTMHRPYASLAHGEGSKYATSLAIAVNAADKLIALSAHARPEMLNHAALAVPGHMTWGPLHCFSAAMFFCFQIINNPEQPGARLHRANVLRALAILESYRGVRVAEKALDILRTLGPLYTETFLSDTPETREQKKQVVLPAVRRLQFPYVDCHRVPIGPGNGALSPALVDATQPPPAPHPIIQGTRVHVQEADAPSMPPSVPLSAPMLQPHRQHLLHQHHQPQQQQQLSTCENLPPSLKWSHPNLAFGDTAHYLGQQQQGHSALALQQPQQQYRDALPRQRAEEGDDAMWRSAAHHSPTARTMMASEPSTAPPPSRPHYAPHMIQQQDAYSQRDGTCTGGGSAADARMGDLAVVTEGVPWGATSGFVQGEWDRMYTGLGGRMPHGS
ncbi:hypothetical protein F5148DRAFT_1324980 [Russula earlei]|uniref:Uncharacterized protein n=1 Tax=Russula earlei TaxID=71964 RepID=A0ACC0U0J9_9AGAM|nr:hypothetical protein F5148DRAFT_1324980 [Russula earlei]